jgi:dihydrofolate synthase/folylpolyglutamate synthase
VFSEQDELERFLLSRPATGRRNGAAPDAPRERTREVPAGLGDPQEAVRTVHVAGTAGKGSVCAFVASLLARHGFRVGVQASPHVHGIRERFRTGDLPVRADVLDDRLAAVARSVAALAATVAATHPGHPVTWVRAPARDKDLGEAVRAVAGAGARVVATGLPGGVHASRHRSPSEIAAAAGAAGVPAVAVADPADAVDHALTTAGGEPVVVTGSFRLPGAVASRLDRRAVPEGQPA